MKTKYLRLTPWLLLLVFVGPWLTAQIIYAKRDQLTFKTIETGTLLSPPIKAESLPYYNANWLGKWQLVYIGTENKPEMLAMLKQIREALGKEKHRVSYQLITTPAQSTLTDNTALLLIDPRGWVIMRYPANPNPIGVLKDFRRLLRYSHG